MMAIPISNQSNLATKFFLLERIKRDKSVSQRLSNEFTAGLVSNVRKNLRTTYSLPRREGNRNEKTVCNTRYQPRNWRRGVERISWQDRHDRIRGGKTFKQSFFFFFFFTTAVGITAEPFLFFFYFPSPFFLSFFRRLLLLRNWSLGSTSILSSADCMQKFNGAWKLKDTSNFME